MNLYQFDSYQEVFLTAIINIGIDILSKAMYFKNLLNWMLPYIIPPTVVRNTYTIWIRILKLIWVELDQFAIAGTRIFQQLCPESLSLSNVIQTSAIISQ